MTELDPLQTLLLEFLDRVDGGEDARTLLDELSEAHPGHADALRRRLSLLRSMGVLTGEGTAEMPERLGEFKLIRRLGGGGMGVVYLAEQDGLDRHVALKVIRPAQLFFEGARERFRREVEAIASLQHPGIVPIYAVGETDGVPYFAMERVAGCTLAELLAEVSDRDPAQLTGADMAAAIAKHTAEAEAPATPAFVFAGSWEEAALHLTRQLADALHHAHRRGVLHRDVKPSNVMVTPDGRAMLLDFGLASAGTDGERDGSLTRTGALLGSMPYMSPEQTRGESHVLDARSDVYALGVTFYELLALCPAFGSDSSPETVAAIQQGQRKPPQQLNPGVSWEAETVCLTAMDPDPARRYASVVDLHRDLGNVLEHRPIEARRASAWLRMRRWAQRHPTATVASVLGAVLLIGGPSLVAWQQREARLEIQGKNDRIESDSKVILDQNDSLRELTDTLTARNDEILDQSAKISTQSVQVQRQFNLALLTVDSMLTRVGATTLADVPQMTAVRRELLGQALEFYRLLLDEQPDDANVLLSLARALHLEGEVLGLLGEISLAEASQLQAIEILERLAADHPEDTGATAELAVSLRKLGAQVLAAGRLDEALDLTARAADAQQALLERTDDPDGSQRAQFVMSLVNLGSMQNAAERNDDAARTFGRALTWAREVVEELPADPRPPTVLARALTGAGRAAELEGQIDLAVRHFDEALEVYDACLVSFPGNAGLRAEQANVWCLKGFLQSDDHELAAEAYLQGYRLQEELTRDFPDTAGYQQQLAYTCLQLAELNDEHGQGPVEARYREALIRQQAMLEYYPELELLRADHAQASVSFASWLHREERLDEALEQANIARDYYLALQAAGLLDSETTPLLEECELIRQEAAAAMQDAATGG